MKHQNEFKLDMKEMKNIKNKSNVSKIFTDKRWFKNYKR